MNVVMSPSTNTTTTDTTSNSTKGIAGRTDYASWDRLATDLVEQVDQEEQAEEEQARKQVGLDGKYARSAAEAEERQKLQQVQETKKKLESFQQREQALQQTFTGLLGPVPVAADDTVDAAEKPPPRSEATKSSCSAANKTTVRITRNDLEAGKRVVTIADTSGSSKDDTIVLTTDLSHLKSKMGLNPHAKSFAGDAENNVPSQVQQQQQRSIFGLIKVFLTNLHNCTVLVKCKIISGTIEIHNCQNLKVEIHADATVATIQADLSRNVQLEFHDAPSGKNTAAAVGHKNRLYWGDDADDRIFHAGVEDMTVRLFRDGVLEHERTADYKRDGATAVGNATAEECQFITSVVADATTTSTTTKQQPQLLTEKVVRAGSSTGAQVRAMTERELEAEEKRRAAAEKMAIAMAESMVQIKDKDGNVLVQKIKPKEEEKANDAVQEILTDSVQDVIKECEQNKARGNEAFGAGEYGQAILLYTLALDKAEELNDGNDKSTSSGGTSDNNTSLFPRDIVYSNRAACFLKLGQHEKALQDANHALQINPDNLKANFRKGLALHAMKQFDAAMPVLAKAHQTEPKNKQIKQALQFCEMRLQQEQRKRMMG